MVESGKFQGEVLSRRKFAYDWADVVKILGAARAIEDKKAPGSTLALCMVLAFTGRRVGEVCGDYSRKVRAYWVGPDGKVDKSKYELRGCPVPGLHVEDIDFQHGTITWTLEKKLQRKRPVGLAGGFQEVKRVTRSLPMESHVAGALRWYLTTNPGKHTFDKVFQFTRQTAWNKISAAVKLAGVKNKAHYCHAFRHGFALRCLELSSEPAALLDLQENLQHSNLSTTLTYLRFRKGSDGRGLLSRLEAAGFEVDGGADDRQRARQQQQQQQHPEPTAPASTDSTTESAGTAPVPVDPPAVESVNGGETGAVAAA